MPTRGGSTQKRRALVSGLYGSPYGVRDSQLGMFLGASPEQQMKHSRFGKDSTAIKAIEKHVVHIVKNHNYMQAPAWNRFEKSFKAIHDKVALMHPEVSKTEADFKKVMQYEKTLHEQIKAFAQNVQVEVGNQVLGVNGKTLEMFHTFCKLLSLLMLSKVSERGGLIKQLLEDAQPPSYLFHDILEALSFCTKPYNFARIWILLTEIDKEKGESIVITQCLSKAYDVNEHPENQEHHDGGTSSHGKKVKSRDSVPNVKRTVNEVLCYRLSANPNAKTMDRIFVDLFKRGIVHRYASLFNENGTVNPGELDFSGFDFEASRTAVATCYTNFTK